MTTTVSRPSRDKRFPELALPALERDYSLLDAFPRAVDAAKMLGVEETRLSRSISAIAPWFDRAAHKRGRELRLPPDLVLDAARRFKQRPLSEVSARLLDYATDHAPHHAELVDDAIERYFAPAEQAAVTEPSIAELLDALRGEVPDDVHRRLVEVAARLGAAT